MNHLSTTLIRAHRTNNWSTTPAISVRHVLTSNSNCSQSHTHKDAVKSLLSGSHQIHIVQNILMKSDKNIRTNVHYCNDSVIIICIITVSHLPASWSDAKRILTAFPLENQRRPQDAFVLHGWRLSKNPTTSAWMKQLTWLRIVHRGDLCLCLVLRTPSGACKKRRSLLIKDYDDALWNETEGTSGSRET